MAVMEESFCSLNKSLASMIRSHGALRTELVLAYATTSWE